MADDTVNLILKIKDQASKELGQVADKAKDVADNVEGINRASQRLGQFGSVMTLGVTTPLLAAGGAALGLVTNLGNTASELQAFSRITGISTDTLQEWRFVADSTGTSFDSLKELAGQFTEQLATGSRFTEEFNATMDALGVSVFDSEGNLRSMNDVLPEIFTALRNIEDETVRTNIAYNVFGGSVKELLPMLGLTNDEFEALTRTARESGAVLSEDALNSAVDFRNSLQELRAQLAGVFNELALDLIPVAQEFVGVLQDHVVPAVRSVIGVVGDLVSWYSNLSDTHQTVVTTVTGVVVAIGPLSLALSRLPALIEGVKLALQGLQRVPLVAWLSLALGAITAIAVALSGRKDNELVGALEKARNAMASGDSRSLTGSLDIVITKFDGDFKQALLRAQDELIRTGEIGVESVNNVTRALEALTAQQAVTATTGFLLTRQPVRDALDIVGSTMFGDRRMPNAFNQVMEALQSGDIEEALGIVNQVLRLLEEPITGNLADRVMIDSPTINSLRDFRDLLKDSLRTIEMSESTFNLNGAGGRNTLVTTSGNSGPDTLSELELTEKHFRELRTAYYTGELSVFEARKEASFQVDKLYKQLIESRMRGDSHAIQQEIQARWQLAIREEKYYHDEYIALAEELSGDREKYIFNSFGREEVKVPFTLIPRVEDVPFTDFGAVLRNLNAELAYLDRRLEAGELTLQEHAELVASAYQSAIDSALRIEGASSGAIRNLQSLRDEAVATGEGLRIAAENAERLEEIQANNRKGTVAGINQEAATNDTLEEQLRRQLAIADVHTELDAAIVKATSDYEIYGSVIDVNSIKLAALRNAIEQLRALGLEPEDEVLKSLIERWTKLNNLVNANKKVRETTSRGNNTPKAVEFDTTVASAGRKLAEDLKLIDEEIALGLRSEADRSSKTREAWYAYLQSLIEAGLGDSARAEFARETIRSLGVAIVNQTQAELERASMEQQVSYGLSIADVVTSDTLSSIRQQISTVSDALVTARELYGDNSDEVNRLSEALSRLNEEYAKTEQEQHVSKLLEGFQKLRETVNQVFDGVSSVLSSVLGAEHPLTQFAGTLEETFNGVMDVMSNIASGNWVGAIVSGVKTVIGFIKSVMDWFKPEWKKISEEIERTLNQSVVAGISNAIREYASNADMTLDELREALRRNVYSAVLDAIIGAIVQGAIIEGALKETLKAISDAAAKGDWAAVRAGVAQAGQMAIDIGEKVVAATGPLLEDFRQILGSAEEVNAQTQEVAQFGQFVSQVVAIPFYDAALRFEQSTITFAGAVERLTNEGITVNSKVTINNTSYVPAY